MGKELERGNFLDSLLRMVFHFKGLSKKSVDEGFRMPKRGQHEIFSDYTLKSVSFTARPTTSCRKSCTSSSILSILYDIVRGYEAGGGGGGACAGAGAGAGTRIFRVTSSAVGPASSTSWAPAAATYYLSGPWATQAHVSPYLVQMLSLPSLCKSIKGSSRVTTCSPLNPSSLTSLKCIAKRLIKCPPDSLTHSFSLPHA
ncbi:hypothetical protein Tco_0764280 [Tanacetum coccineum]